MFGKIHLKKLYRVAVECNIYCFTVSFKFQFSIVSCCHEFVGFFSPFSQHFSSEFLRNELDSEVQCFFCAKGSALYLLRKLW